MATPSWKKNVPFFQLINYLLIIRSHVSDTGDFLFMGEFGRVIGAGLMDALPGIGFAYKYIIIVSRIWFIHQI